MKLLEWKRMKDMDIIQATLNPKGPGAVRIHMVPPRISPFHKIAPALVFINGNDILPVRKGHTILLANFMEELDKYDGKPISEEDMDSIVAKTIERTRKVYYRTKPEVMTEDLRNLVEDFCRLAYGQPLESQYPIFSIGQYAKNMLGPHRMDLMVSPMTDSQGNWHCNNRCLHCYAAGQKYAGGEVELTTEEWKTILKKLYDAHVCQVTFTGGEPTMRKDLPELVKAARYFISRVNTNGILLTEEYCQKLVDAELDSIQITLYSADEETHNRLVGTKSFQKTVAGIKNAVAAGLSVSINTPICAINSDYSKTLELIHELGVRYVSCSSIITTGNALQESSQHTQLTESELVAILEKATKYCEEKGYPIEKLAIQFAISNPAITTTLFSSASPVISRSELC